MDVFKTRVERLSADKLVREVWEFELVRGLTLVLATYTKERREKQTSRRWENLLHYDRLRTRSASVAVQAIPFPPSVHAEARTAMIAAIRVVKQYP